MPLTKGLANKKHASDIADHLFSSGLFRVFQLFVNQTSFFACRIAQRLAGEGDSSIVQGNMYFPFSTLVFGSWDFHITNVEAAKKLRRGIRMQVTS